MSPALSGGFLTIGKKMKVVQSCLTLCGLMNYTVHGILQVRILEWVAFPFSRGSFQRRDRTQVSRTNAHPTYVIRLWITNVTELCKQDALEKLQVLRFREKLTPTFFIKWVVQLVFLSFKISLGSVPRSRFIGGSKICPFLWFLIHRQMAI